VKRIVANSLYYFGRSFMISLTAIFMILASPLMLLEFIIEWGYKNK
jgi:hypothetical protein